MARGKTPINAGYLLSIDYTTGGLTHKVQGRCNATLVGGFYNLGEFSGSSILASTAATHFATTIAPVMPSTCVFSQYTLYQYVSGVYNPVEQAGITVSPSSLTDVEPTSIMTVKYRDTAFKPVNFIVLGAAITAPERAAPFGLLATLTTEMLNTADNHVGAWFLGRFGVNLHTVGEFTVSLSRTSRRRLGLV